MLNVGSDIIRHLFVYDLRKDRQAEMYSPLIAFDYNSKR